MSTPRRPVGSIRVRLTMTLENDAGRSVIWSELVRVNNENTNARTESWISGEATSQWRALLRGTKA